MKTRTSNPMSLGSLLLACICFLTMPGCGSGRGEQVDSASAKQVAVACATSTMSATLAGTAATAQFNKADDGSARAVFTVPGADGQPEAHRMDVAANYPFAWSNASDTEARLVVPTEQGTKNVLLSVDGYDPTTKTASLHLREEGGADLGTISLQDDNLDAFFAQGPDGTQGTTLVGQSLRPLGWFIPPGIAALCTGPQASVCLGIGIAILIAIAIVITVILVQQNNCYADLRAARSDCNSRSNAQQSCSISTSGCNLSISAAPPSISLGGPVIGPCNCTPIGQPPADAGGGGPDTGDPDDPPPQPGQPPAPCPQHDFR